MTLIFGVLNVTPDSFSDGGAYFDTDLAIAHGISLYRAGADVIDVGGESTRPGSAPVTVAEEIGRVVAVIAGLTQAGVPTSIDTIHAETARAAVVAGATYINDVSGGTHDPAMYACAAELGVTYIAMHWRGVPDPMHQRSTYARVVAEVSAELATIAEAALSAGILPERLVLDPGLGFDKTAEQGWQLLAGMKQLAALGYPIFIGVSRKRMIRESLGRDAVTRDQDTASAAVSVLAAQHHAWGVRVHDVAATVSALAVLQAWREAERKTHAPKQDVITLTGLEIFAHHGVFDFERETGQPFVIDVAVVVDLTPASRSDDLAATVNYAELADAVVESVAGDPVDLIETVAERVATVALKFAGVQEARVTVHKPQAPISQVFGDVSVRIVRKADS